MTGVDAGRHPARHRRVGATLVLAAVTVLVGYELTSFLHIAVPFVLGVIAAVLAVALTFFPRPSRPGPLGRPRLGCPGLARGGRLRARPAPGGVGNCPLERGSPGGPGRPAHWDEPAARPAIGSGALRDPAPPGLGPHQGQHPRGLNIPDVTVTSGLFTTVGGTSPTALSFPDVTPTSGKLSGLPVRWMPGPHHSLWMTQRRLRPGRAPLGDVRTTARSRRRTLRRAVGR